MKTYKEFIEAATKQEAIEKLQWQIKVSGKHWHIVQCEDIGKGCWKVWYVKHRTWESLLESIKKTRLCKDCNLATFEILDFQVKMGLETTVLAIWLEREKSLIDYSKTLQND